MEVQVAKRYPDEVSQTREDEKCRRLMDVLANCDDVEQAQDILGQVGRMLSDGASVTNANFKNENLLHLCGKFCNRDLMKRVLSTVTHDEKTAMVNLTAIEQNQTESDLATPLMYAIKGRNAACIKLLVGAGAELDVDKLPSLLVAVVSRDATLTRFLLEVCRKDVNQSDSEGNTVLMRAVLDNELELAGILLRAGARVNHRNAIQQTAWQFAVEGGHIPMVKLLMKHGASVKDMYLYGDHALNTAVYQNNMELVKFLLQHGGQETINGIHDDSTDNQYLPLTAVFKSGKIPLISDCSQKEDNVDMLEFLLANGADPTVLYPRLPDGTSILHHAIHCNKLKCLEYILSDKYIHCVDLEATEELKGYTPLFQAISMGDQPIIDLLLERGAKTGKHASTPHGYGALEFCLHTILEKQTGRQKAGYVMLKALLRYGMEDLDLSPAASDSMKEILCTNPVAVEMVHQAGSRLPVIDASQQAAFPTSQVSFTALQRIRALSDDKTPRSLKKICKFRTRSLLGKNIEHKIRELDLTLPRIMCEYLNFDPEFEEIEKLYGLR